MVDKKFNPIDCNNVTEFDSDKMKFLPYYVGKIESKLSLRLSQHKNITTDKNAKKYIRLSLNYLKEFFKNTDYENIDINFPIKTNNSTPIYKKLIDIDKENYGIEYYNNSKFLEYKLKLNNDLMKINPNDNPIDLFESVNDTLDQIINGNNNFWFCYGISDIEKDSLFSCYLESFETLTYYSLKGKTVSKTGVFHILLEEIELIDNTKSNIFKAKYLTKEIIKNNFYNYQSLDCKVDFKGDY
jgi:hypothetical protein